MRVRRQRRREDGRPAARRRPVRGRGALAGLALALAACAAPAPPPEGAAATSPASPPAHLVLVTVDTWRGDHWATTRGGVPLTPRLAARAATAARFTTHSSTAPQTSPGVASLLTGLLPHRSGVLSNPHVLQPEVPSLPKLLRAQGFATAAFVANPVLRPGVGFDGGFDTYELVAAQRPAHKTRAAAVVASAWRWLDAPRSASRFFLWVHLMEPHGPYEPPAATAAAFAVEQFGEAATLPLLAPGDNSGRGGIPYYQQQYTREGGAASGDPRAYALRYAAEVASVDAAVDALLAGLAERRLLGDAVVVLTADHGEALRGDHGFYFAHGHGATEDQLHVPLVVWAPGELAGERRHPTSSVDVLPTALRLLGLPAAPDLDGRDLFAAGERPVFAQAGRELMVRQGDWKLRWPRPAAPALYQLSSDPGERHDRATAEEGVRRRLEEDLAASRRLRPLVQPRRREGASGEERRHLEALGYL